MEKNEHYKCAPITVKGKFVPIHTMNAYGGAELQLYLCLFTALDVGAHLLYSQKWIHQYPKKRRLVCSLQAVWTFLRWQKSLVHKTPNKTSEIWKERRQWMKESKKKRKQSFKIIYFFPLACSPHSTRMGRLWMSYCQSIMWSTNNFKQLKHFHET